MVKEIKLLDKIHLQKYIYLITSFLSDKIQASAFEEFFILIRRDDSYWLSSSFDDAIGRTLDPIFLDVDEYNPDELYDPNDQFNINENELRKRLTDKLSVLNSFSCLMLVEQHGSDRFFAAYCPRMPHLSVDINYT